MRDIDWVRPPVEPIPITLGTSLVTSIKVSHNFILLLSTLYTK